ncbi:MAG: hypothetical protein U0V70_00270 [Terriglobia bacterium]
MDLLDAPSPAVNGFLHVPPNPPTWTLFITSARPVTAESGMPPAKDAIAIMSGSMSGSAPYTQRAVLSFKASLDFIHDQENAACSAKLG